MREREKRVTELKERNFAEMRETSEKWVGKERKTVLITNNKKIINNII